MTKNRKSPRKAQPGSAPFRTKQSIQQTPAAEESTPLSTVPRWGAIAALAAVGVTVIVFGTQTLFSYDFGIHVATGRWILDHARFPAYDVFTYTLNTHRDIDLWWIYHVFLALVDRLGGIPAVILSNSALTLVSFGLVLVRALRRTPNGLPLLPWFFLLGILAWNFEVRPHVLSWIYLNGILLVLERYGEDRRSPLWPMVVLQCLWINSQPLGAMGWGVIGAVVIGRWIADRSLDKRLLAYGVAAVATAVINPYFIEGLSLPLTQFGFLRSPTIFKQYIYEFISPFTLDEYRAGGRLFFLQSLFPFHLYALVALGGLALGLRRRHAPDLVLFAVLAYLFALAQKNFGFFFFGTLPFLYEGYTRWLSPPPGIDVLQSSGSRRRWNWGTFRFALFRWAWIPALGVALMLIPFVITNGYNVLMRTNFEFGLGVNKSRLPVETVRFLQEHKLRGRLLNSHDIGGYLMATVPQPTFIDGRHHVIGEQFFRAYMAMRTPQGMNAALKRFNPEIAIFPYTVLPEWMQYFTSSKEWRLVAYDDMAAVFLREGYAPEILRLTEERALAAIAPLGGAETDSLLLLHRPGGARWFLSALALRQHDAFGESNKSILALSLGWPRVARLHALHALKSSSIESPAVFFNLGDFFFRTQEFSRSAQAYRRFLELDNDPVARDRLELAEILTKSYDAGRDSSVSAAPAVR